MGRISSKLRSVDGGRLMFWCPGCDGAHQVRIEGDGSPRWSWNGDAEKPTFYPSILCTSHTWKPEVTPENMAEFKRNPWPQTKADEICHSFVVDGEIRFLPDCTHHLAGQTADLPDFDDDERITR